MNCLLFSALFHGAERPSACLTAGLSRSVRTIEKAPLEYFYSFPKLNHMFLLRISVLGRQRFNILDSVDPVLD